MAIATMLEAPSRSLISRDKVKQSLKDFFGFSGFKGNQQDIIDCVLEGRDTFVIMPTGGGKSLCYQLPALVSDGCAIIISPLIALMKNQVDLISAFGGRTGVAHFLNSSLSKRESEIVKADVSSGLTKMLYIAPESLTKEETLEFLRSITVPFVAVDEAHCISEWGHDFRPEYRRIREIVDAIGNVPLIALTASATPKVQDDIMKTLKMKNTGIFRSSFNRPNLYYEVRPKQLPAQTIKEIVAFIKRHQGKSGIVYCLSRKTVEETADALRVNGIKALEYHAGLDAATRSRNQDAFLMEKVDVIVATIAFGMGIDKPDVRFVVHFDVPKSIESYYQETGRAGRDGMPSDCLMFYKYKDLTKLEKFLKDKPVAEREIGGQLLEEMAAFCENATCRRKAMLHYFGEEYDDTLCEEGKMCDNHRFPKERVDGMQAMTLALETMIAMKDQFMMDHIIEVIRGVRSENVHNYNHTRLDTFGEGKEKDYNYWKSVMRTGLREGLVEKSIENYGTQSVTEKGKAFLAKPYAFPVAIDTDFASLPREVSGEGEGADPILLAQLQDLRKSIAVQKKLPPYIIFQDNSLDEMAIKYPITMEELGQITGVSTGKAERYGKPFVEIIAKYVEENEIERAEDYVVRSVINRSAQKVNIIQNIDRKIPLADIAKSRNLSMDDLMQELENIVYSGTRVNIDYHINGIIDPEYQQEVFDYFRGAEDASIDKAYHAMDGAYDASELQLLRIKFVSEMAN